MKSQIEIFELYIVSAIRCKFGIMDYLRIGKLSREAQKINVHHILQKEMSKPCIFCSILVGKQPSAQYTMID